MEGGAMAAGDAPTDRLSMLPEKLLLRILSFLSMREAISFARISRLWRNLWAVNSCLDFCSYDPELSSDFIDTALLLHHRVQVRTFRAAVCTTRHIKEDKEDQLLKKVNDWVRYALKCKVEELHLDCYDPIYQYSIFQQDSPLPSSLYISKSLVSLWLRHCILEPTPSVSMTSLKHLTLCKTDIVDTVLEQLLAGCPIIESITLEDCNSEDWLNVDAQRANPKTLKIRDNEPGKFHDPGYGLLVSAPTITTLVVQGYMRTNYDMQDLSSLVTASLVLRDMFSEKVKRGNYECLRDLLRDLRHVRVLKLCSWCIQVLSVKAPESSWSSLDFNIMSLQLAVGFTTRELPGIFLTLRSFTKLEYLPIDVYENRRIRFFDDIAEEYFVDERTYVIQNERSSPNMLRHLKTVGISGLLRTLCAVAENGAVEQIREIYHNGFNFIRFLLQNSPVLERLTISDSESASKRTNRNFMNRFRERLLRLPKASPNAEVIFEGW